MKESHEIIHDPENEVKENTLDLQDTLLPSLTLENITQNEKNLKIFLAKNKTKSQLLFAY